MNKSDLTEDEKIIIDALRKDPDFIHDLAEILKGRKGCSVPSRNASHIP